MRRPSLTTHQWWVVGYAVLAIGVFYLWHSQQNTVQDNQTVAAKAAKLARANARLVREVQREARLGAQTHKAVCTLKKDYAQRVAEGVQFLATHPNGAFGIPEKTLEETILNEQKNVRALAALKC